MEQNVGFTDRYLRLTLGSLALAMGAARLARNPDMTGVALGVLGGMTLADGILGTCPYYSMVGINTRNEEHHYQEHTNDRIAPHEGI